MRDLRTIFKRPVIFDQEHQCLKKANKRVNSGKFGHFLPLGGLGKSAHLSQINTYINKVQKKIHKKTYIQIKNTFKHP